MDAHLSGAPCQSGCQGFVGQGLSAGSFQQGFLNSDPWANWLNQRQAQEFYNQQLLLQQQFRNAQSGQQLVCLHCCLIDSIRLKSWEVRLFTHFADKGLRPRPAWHASSAQQKNSMCTDLVASQLE